MRYSKIPMSLVRVNEYNPNQMMPSVKEHLKKTIESCGFIDPITVREKGAGEGFVIIDGEHRFLVWKELGNEQIDATILNDTDLLAAGDRLKAAGKIREVNPDAVAKVLTVLMNEIKGESNPLKYAELLEQLSASFDIDQLSSVLNKSSEELANYKMLLKLDDISLPRPEPNREEEKEFEITFTPTKEQLEIIDAAIKKSGITELSEAFTAICSAFVEGEEGP